MKSYSCKNHHKLIVPVIIINLMGCLIFCCIIFSPQILKAEIKKPSLNDKEDSEILATVNGQKITVSDFEQEMMKQGGLTKERFNNMDEKKRVLEEMIRFELFASEALREGYDKDPEIVDFLKKRMVQKYLRKNFDEKLQSVVVTDEEISDYYQKHIDEYNKPPLLKIAIIWIKASDNASQTERAELKKRAEEALSEAGKEKPGNNSFGEIAREYSDDMDTKYNGGILGWIDPKRIIREDIPHEVFDEALALNEIGDISPIIDTAKGFYLVRLVEKRLFKHVTLKQAESEIRYKLSSKKRQALYKDYYEKLKKGADISINLDLLRSIKGEEFKGGGGKHYPPSFPIGIR